MLYWNRIQFFNKSEAIWFEVKDVDIEEDFEDLFAKTTTTQATNKVSKKPNEAKKSVKQECVKLLDSKRSQQIGILMSSQHLDSQIVRDTLLGFDSQVLSYETLNSIYAIRPQEDELRAIQVKISRRLGMLN